MEKDKKVTSETITFKQPNNLNVGLTLFTLLMLIIGALCFSLLSYFYGVVSYSLALGIIFFALVLWTLLGIISNIKRLVIYRTVSIDENLIRVKYLLPLKSSFELNLNDCVAYFSYSQSVRAVAGHAAVDLYDDGVFLKFKNNKIIQFKLTTSKRNLIDPLSQSKNLSQIKSIIDLLNKKQVKNVTPTESPFIINGILLPSKNVKKMATEAFLSLVV